MSLTVYIDENFTPGLIEHLTPMLDNEISICTQHSSEESATCDILVSGLPNEEQLKENPNLKAIIIPWAGLPVKTKELMHNFPSVTVHNLHHNAQVVAEMAFTMMLSSLKNLIKYDQLLRKDDWTPRYQTDGPKTFSNRNALILGFGEIGLRIANLCSSIGINVTAVNRTGVSSHPNNFPIHPIDKLDSLLPQAEILFVSLPLTDNTRGLINKTRLALVPDKATVINIARGSIINEKALYDELKSGRISAGLDVWYNYPETEAERSHTPPSLFPFHKLDNVIMTPHLSGHSDNIELLRAKALSGMLNLAVKDQPLPNEVDLKAGY